MEEWATREFWEDGWRKFAGLHADFLAEANGDFGAGKRARHMVDVNLSTDLVLIAIYSIVLFVVMRALELGVKVALRHTPLRRLLPVADNMVTKYSEEVGGALWHTVALLVELAALMPSAWWPATKNPYENGTGLFWTEYPVVTITSGLKVLHLSQMGYYIQGVFTFLVVSRPKDFTTMMIHHVVAFTLICFSYLTGLLKVGTAIMLIHEIADIPLRLSKIMHYAKMWMMSNITFTVATLVWLVTRLLVYPRVVWGVLFEIPIETHWCIWILRPLLCVLQVMHVVWFKMMVRILTNAITGREDPELLKRRQSLGEGNRRRASSASSTASERIRRNSFYDLAATSRDRSLSSGMGTHMVAQESSGDLFAAMENKKDQ